MQLKPRSHPDRAEGRRASPDHALRVWVLIHKQAEGTWGAGGTIIRFADLKALSKASKEPEL
ncbi:hypothetical protein GCM10022221_31400 [Actinocorallia aurea]